MDKRPIGVFDSGMGGLTAVRQLQAILPGEDIVYFGDTGRVPYGSRSPETIRQYAEQDIRFLLSQDVKFLLAACGTVSSTLPKSYTEALPVPYVGVVGAAVSAAAAATKNGRIGVIATPATIRSRSYENRIRSILPGAEVFTKSCPMFVPLVENGYVGPNDPITTAIAHEYLDEIRAKGVDTLILGCTHAGDGPGRDPDRLRPGGRPQGPGYAHPAGPSERRLRNGRNPLFHERFPGELFRGGPAVHRPPGGGHSQPDRH